MREAAILTFSFKFLNKKGYRVGRLLPKVGRIDHDGVTLGEERILFQDIYKVSRYKKKLAIILYPFPVTGKQTSRHFIEDYATLLLRVRDLPEDVERSINRRISAVRTTEHHKQLGIDRRKKLTGLHHLDCPICDAVVDLGGLPESLYTYCDYCGSLFDNYGNPLHGSKDYKICPETGFFDRVRHYHETLFYIERKGFFAKRRAYYCSDTFAEVIFRRTIYKNIPLLFGLIPTFYNLYRARKGRDQNYPKLIKANLLTLEGKFDEAEIAYQQDLIRYPNHPGLNYNLGLFYIKTGKKEKAVQSFYRALSNCSNYTPAKELLKKYSE